MKSNKFVNFTYVCSNALKILAYLGIIRALNLDSTSACLTMLCNNVGNKLYINCNPNSELTRLGRQMNTKSRFVVSMTNSDRLVIEVLDGKECT